MPLPGRLCRSGNTGMAVRRVWEYERERCFTDTADTGRMRMQKCKNRTGNRAEIRKTLFGRAVTYGLCHMEYLCAAVLLFCFWALHIGSVYGFSIFPDEFAYWSHAAGAAGYDWRHITSLAPYYSYGYSVVLFPVFVLCKDAVTAYRVAIGFNYFFLAASLMLLAGTVKKMVPEENGNKGWFCVLTILSPYYLFYAQTTLAEVFLLALYITAGSLLFRYLEGDRLSDLALFVAVLAYSYMVHMRTVGVVLSGMFVLAVHILARRGKKRHILAAFGMALLFFAAAGFIKERILLDVYGSTGQNLAAGNDYGGQVGKIRYIFTEEGICDLAVSLLGKILYLGLATYGMFYWGVYGLVKQTAGNMRPFRSLPDAGMEHGGILTARRQFALFLLLAAAAQIAVATVYLLTLGEIDDYTYGRYSETVIPFITAYGFTVLWKERTKVVCAVTGLSAVMQGLVTFFVVRQVSRTGADIFHGYFTVGIGYLYRGEDFTAGGFYAQAYVFCECLTALVTGSLLFCRKRGKKRHVFTALAVMELALAVHSVSLYLAPFQKAAFRDARLADKITAFAEEGRRIIYMDDCFPSYIGILQFMARDVEIRVMERKDGAEDYGDSVTGEDVLVFAFDDAFLREWSDRYAWEDTYGHFTLLYNVYGQEKQKIRK